MKPEPRRAVPMKLQRDLALKLVADLMRKLGMIPADADPSFQLDHTPALALRAVDPVTAEHIPHQHDPEYLVWLTKEAHAAKTFGTGATTRGADAGDIAHGRRLTDKEVAFRARLLARDTGAEPPEPKRRKAQIAQRPKKPTRQQHSATRIPAKLTEFHQGGR